MRLTFILFLISVSSVGYSQNLDNQFKDLMESTQTFKDYKVIKIEEINSFWSSVADSLDIKDQMLIKANEKGESLNNQLNDTKADLENEKSKVVTLEEQVSSVSVFGINAEKTVFKSIVFSIIAGLMIVIGVLLFRLKERGATAKISVKSYEDVVNEFEIFKKDSLDKQMKLRRELQTERNKLEEKRSTV